MTTMFRGNTILRFVPLVTRNLPKAFQQPIVRTSEIAQNLAASNKFSYCLENQKSFFHSSPRYSQDRESYIRDHRLCFLEALKTRDGHKLTELLKKAHRHKATGLLCRSDSDLRLVESNLLNSIPTSQLSHDPLLFSSVIGFLIFSKGLDQQLLKRFLQQQDRFSSISTDIDTPVALLSLFNKAGVKLSQHTRESLDEWMTRYLRNTREKRIARRFNQLISVCGNARLTFGHSTSVQLANHMMEVLVTDKSSKDLNVSLATFLWYWKNTEYAVSHYSSTFYPAWEAIALESVHKCNEQQCTMILNALADQELKPGDEFLRKLCNHMREIGFTKTQHVANSLRSLALMMKSQQFEQLELILESDILSMLGNLWFQFLKAHQLTAQNVSNGISAIAVFHQFNPSITEGNFIEVFFECSEDILPKCNAQAFSNIFLALSKLTAWTSIPPNWLKLFWKSYSVAIPSSIDQGLANMFSAISLFDLSPVEFKHLPLEVMFEEVKMRVSKAADIHLSQWVLHSGKLGIKDQEMIEKSLARIIELCEKRSVSERLASNVAAGLSLLDCVIPTELCSCISSSVKSLSPLQLFAVLDAMTMQSCVLNQPVSVDFLLHLSSQINVEEVEKVAELGICQSALAWFGADYFPKSFVGFIKSNKQKLQNLLQEEYNRIKLKEPKNMREADIVEILGMFLQLDDPRLHKVIPEAGCVVNVEVQGREDTKRKCAIQIHGPKNYYYHPNGKCTFEETSSTKKTKNILKKLGYYEVTIHWYQKKSDIIAMLNDHFGEYY